MHRMNAPGRKAAFLLLLAACWGRGESEIPTLGADATGPVELRGSSWVLEDLAGAGVVQRGRATLEFADSGRAFGRGSCNRFSGPVTLSGDKISFGPLLSTKMACVEDALTNQETRYFAALGEAERYAVEGDTLRIYLKRGGDPLRFSRATPP